MLSESLLKKLRIGAAGVGASLILATPAAVIAGDSASPASACVAVSALSEAELKLLKTMIPQMGHSDYEVRQHASYAVLAMGQKVTNHLNQALDAQSDPEIRERLRVLVDVLNPKPQQEVRIVNGCMGKCGRG